MHTSSPAGTTTIRVSDMYRRITTGRIFTGYFANRSVRGPIRQDLLVFYSPNYPRQLTTQHIVDEPLTSHGVAWHGMRITWLMLSCIDVLWMDVM